MTAPIALPSVITLGTRKASTGFPLKYQRDKEGKVQQTPQYSLLTHIAFCFTSETWQPTYTAMVHVCP